MEIIGEAVSAIPLEIRRTYSDVPWTKIVRVRNIVIHRYFGVDTGTLWVIIKEQIPQLKEQVSTITKDWMNCSDHE